MTTDPVDSLDELASEIDEAFGSYRRDDAFKTVSLVIDTDRAERPTLIIHVDGEEAPSLADRIEEFCTTRGARTERERHSATDIRVLATLDT